MDLSKLTRKQIRAALAKMSEAEKKDFLQRLEAREEKRREDEIRGALKRTTFLPTQQKLVDALYHQDRLYDIVMFTGPNQVGKSHVWACCAGADISGYRPWDNGRRDGSQSA